MLDTDAGRYERKRRRQQIPQSAHARVIDSRPVLGEQHVLSQGTQGRASSFCAERLSASSPGSSPCPAPSGRCERCAKESGNGARLMTNWGMHEEIWRR